MWYNCWHFVSNLVIVNWRFEAIEISPNFTNGFKIFEVSSKEKKKRLNSQSISFNTLTKMRNKYIPYLSYVSSNMLISHCIFEIPFLKWSKDPKWFESSFFKKVFSCKVFRSGFENHLMHTFTAIAPHQKTILIPISSCPFSQTLYALSIR